MIYLKEGNIPLNLCTDDDISQQENNTYQLTFKYPVSDEKWSLLQNEVHLLADDLSGEQEFVIIDIQKEHGYITVYANQVATLLNGYSIRKINVDRANGFTVMNKLVEGLKRECPFTFFSDISELHTLNIENVSVIDALLKGQHSIVGQWGGDLVRDKYSVRLLKNGGIENQSLFMYKKNLSEYKESTTTKSLKTRIHFRKVITASGEGEKDQVLEATVDSPLVDKYKHIYEDDMEVQDQDVKTIEDLKEYGKKYFQSSLCDLPDESLEIDVLGHADQPVKLFDTVSIFYELYNIDIRKKITSYNYSPMSKKLKKIGFGKISRSLGGAIGKIVEDVVKEKIASHDAEYEAKVQKLVDNANAEYDKRAKEIENKVTDGIEEAKARAEVVKEEISAQVTEKIKAASQANKNEIVEEFKAQYNGIEVKMKGLEATTDKLKTSDADIQKLINDFKAQTQSQFVGIQGAQSRFEQTTEKAISDLTNVANGKADRSFVEQTVAGVKEEFTTIGVGGGPNMLRNSRADEGLKYWTEPNGRMSFTSHQFYFNGQKRMFSLRPGAMVQSPRFIVKRNKDYIFNITAFDANTKNVKISFCKRKKGSTSDFEEKQEIFNKTGSPAFSSHEALKRTFKFNIGDFDEGYLLVEYQGNPSGWSGMFMTELDFYEGSNDRLWQPAPEDQNYLVEQAQATFEKTVQGLSIQLTKLETKTGPSGELEQRMLTYSEKAAVDALKATRQILEQGYVAKSQYTEDVAGITRRFDEIVQAGENLLKNSGNPQNVEGWGYYDPGVTPIVTVSTNPLYYNGSRKLFKIENASDTTKAAASQRFNIKRNTTYTISFDAIGSDNLKNATFYFLARKKGETGNFSKVFTLADKITVPQDRITRYYFTVNSEEYDEAFLRFDNTGSSNGQPASLYFGDIDVYEGSIKRAYQPPTNDGSSVIEAKLAEFKQGIDGQFSTFSTEFGMKLSSQNSVINDKLDDFKDSINGRFANYQQTVDGQVATIISQFDGVLKKTDINITDGQISFGTGKTINGRTISSLLVQEPEANALIAKMIKVKGDMVVDGSITSRHLASQSVRTGHMESGAVTTQILASNAVTADKLQVDYALIQKLLANQAFIRELISQKAFITELNSIKIAAERIQGGRVTANSGKSIFDLDSGRLSFYDNFTGVFRDQSNASSQGLFFRNDDVTINGRRYINSKAIIGADRRDNDIRNHWNQGGFNGMIVDTIKGVGTGDHDNADKVTFVGDRFHFTHSYDYDPNTNTNPYGWKITTWGQTTISPFGTNGRNTNVQAGDFLLINNGNNGVWLRQALRTLKTALQHFVNAGFATDDFTPQNGRSMRIALHSSIRNAVANSLREFDKFGI
ncbi:Phage endopeptidase [Streptococcus parasanguinis]|uniref:phage tail spike protein n=1 Tax=Streptococcus parasanguinis TaxID=1318 RepID=UPI0007771381|nr:phage tail spike protein [Streptococcus parasanguinis]KXT88889.1 Phage endopeptidase [Streptococcus parasanguinis]